MKGKKLSDHFYTSEFACKCPNKLCKYKKENVIREVVSKRLLNVLEAIREKVGRPLRVSSGLRCKEWNKRVGGVRDSTHLAGLGVDIIVLGSTDRYWLIFWALNQGIRRIGVYEDGHVHLDVAPELWAQNVLWVK